jgi:acetyl-CoA carboxylase biotin carboxyl carrier protein
MIDIRKLKELVRLMVENDLSELDLKDQEETVTIKRGPSGVPMMHAPGVAPRPVYIGSPDETEAEGGSSTSSGASVAPSPAAAPAASEAGLVAIESPMVGTFYSAPNPDAGPFVSVGAAVGNDTVVCLIEAMKVFNEIKAETSGTIERILVNSGDAVEFGQKLFLVRPG